MATDADDADLVGREGALAYGLREEIVQYHGFEAIQLYFTRDIVLGVPDSVTDDSYLPSLDLGGSAGGLENIPGDTWDVDAEVAEMIHQACRDYSKEDFEQFGERPCHSDPLEQLKLELPIFRGGDGEKEYRLLIQRVQHPEQVCLDEGLVPLDIEMDKDKDECLEFPECAYEFGKEMDRKTGQETMEISRDTAVYFAAQLQFKLSEQDDQAIFDESLLVKGATLPRYLTPPVSPRFLKQELFVPSSDDCCQVEEILSDPASMISEDLKAAEDAIFDKEGEIHPRSSSTTKDGASTPPVSFFQASSPPQTFEKGPEAPQRGRLEDLKLEVPIIRNRKEEPLKVSLAFDSIFKLGQGEDFEKEEILDPEVQEKIQAMSEMITRRAEQEQLEPRDGLARLPVPVLDFSAPQAEWAIVPGDARAMFKHIQDSQVKEFELPDWPKDRRVEAEMPWALGTSSAVISTAETLPEDKQATAAFLDIASDDVPTSGAFLKEAEGLRILRADSEDDEELKPVLVQPGHPLTEDGDLMDLIRKRKQALDEEEAEPQSNMKRKRGGDKVPQHEDVLPITNGRPDSSKLLSTFMMFKGKTRSASRTRDGGQSSPPDTNGTTPQPTHPLDRDKQPGNEPEDPKSTARGVPAFLPPIEDPGFPIKVVVSILLPREIQRSLEALIPSGVEFIERDYDAHNTITWLQGTSKRSTVLSPLRDEADLIVSPATGIVLTSMTKLRQQTIQGSDQNALQRMVHRASRRYERLVVLVSDGSIDDSPCPMSPADERAFAEFQAFAARLGDEGAGRGGGGGGGTSVCVSWVGGGKAALSRWAVALTCRFARQDAAGAAAIGCFFGEEAGAMHRALAQEEKGGEVVLRHAGMNVFAAQVVCSWLQRRQEIYVGMDEDRFGDHGLAAFVAMPHEERVRIFGDMLGGRRVLDRVGEALEQQWI